MRWMLKGTWARRMKTGHAFWAEGACIIKTVLESSAKVLPLGKKVVVVPHEDYGSDGA